MRNLSYAARMLLRSPGFTIAAVLCLALGIGATTAIFSVVNAVVLRPLPYQSPQLLARIYTEFPLFPNGGLRRFWTSAPEWLDLRRETKAWETLEAFTTSGVNLGGGVEPVRATAAFVSGGLLPMLGVSPVKGRLLTAQDDAPEAGLAAVISHGLWQRVFGGDAGVLRREVNLNGRVCTIVGVMPAGFQFPPGEVDAPELWSPLQINPANPGGRSSHFLSLIGRLKAGVSMEQARQELKRVAMEHEKGSGHRFHPQNHPLVAYGLHEEVVGNVRPAMLTMLTAVVFVLLIACGNVANLLLARAEGRQREISIRTAMGADLRALLWQFLVEGVLLSLLGAVFGLALAFAGLRAIVAWQEGSIPRAVEIGVDWQVLLFTLSVSLLTGVFFGLAPLLHRFGKTVAESLKAAGGRTTASVEAGHFRRAMVVAELALSLMLLIGAGLMIRAFWKLQAVETGVRPERVLTMRIALPQQVYPQNERVLQFWEQLLPRVNGLPGVASATMISGMPPVRPINANDTQIEGWVEREGGPGQNIDYYQTVGDRFLEAMGARLVEGRMFDERDGTNAPASLVINQTMARMYWPGQSAIGKRVRPGFRDPWRTVVGVIADIKNAGVDKATGTELFLPVRQSQGFGLRNAFLVIRTHGEPAGIARAARAEISALDASLPVSQVRTMEDAMALAKARPRFLTGLLSTFSGLALVLAALGIYGVMSYLVAQRTNEFGVRMAIGARQSDVLWMVIRQGMWLGMLGVASGALCAAVLARYLKGMLYATDALDPATFLSMAAALTAVVILACFLPALRATRVDPIRALRYE